jgi:hypothetical protein
VPAGLLLGAALIGRPGRPEPVAASRRLGLLFATTVGVFYVGAMQALSPGYRLDTLARRIADLQANGTAVAYAGTYHAQFQFLGRLRQRIDQTKGAQLAAWVAAHPGGYVVARCERWRPPPPGIYGQPYLSGALRLWPAAQLLDDASERRLCDD